MPATAQTKRHNAKSLAATAVMPRKKPASASKSTAAPRRKSKANGSVTSDNLRRNYIEVAAYHIAEQRGFQGGSELEDWLQAEQEVDRLLLEGLLEL